MVIGDPYKFAIIVDTVNQWNPSNNSFHNGVLFYCFNGTLFPKEVQTATLSSDIFDLLPRLRTICIDDELFTQNKDDAFRRLYDFYIEQTGNFDITPLTFSDFDHFVFAVKGNCGVRILANTLCYDKEKSTHDCSSLNTLEAIISQQEYEALVNNLNCWYTSLK